MKPVGLLKRPPVSRLCLGRAQQTVLQPKEWEREEEKKGFLLSWRCVKVGEKCRGGLVQQGTVSAGAVAGVVDAQRRAGALRWGKAAFPACAANLWHRPQSISLGLLRAGFCSRILSREGFSAKWDILCLLLSASLHNPFPSPPFLLHSNSRVPPAAVGF